MQRYPVYFCYVFRQLAHHKSPDDPENGVADLQPGEAHDTGDKSPELNIIVAMALLLIVTTVRSTSMSLLMSLEFKYFTASSIYRRVPS